VLGAALVIAAGGYALTLWSQRRVPPPAFVRDVDADGPVRPEFAPDPAAALNILFIGNSLTANHNLPGMVRELIAAPDAGPAHVVALTRGGYGLEDHWNLTNAPQVIALGEWDLVILQQGPSATEGRPSLLEYSRRIDERVAAIGGRTALYQVWPSSARAFDYDGVCESYRRAAEQIGGVLFPAGEALRLCAQRHPEIPLYRGDGFHPTVEASYLAALVMAGQITGQSPLTLPTTIIPDARRSHAIDLEIARHLQQIALEANERFALP